MDFSLITDKMFNIAGPCNEREHYMLPALGRLPEVVGLLRRRQYFIIHAARQSGKTTAVKFLTDEINKSGQMRALYCSLEAVQQFDDMVMAIKSIAALILEAAIGTGLISLSNADVERFKETGDVASRVKEALRLLSAALKVPVVVFFDEADCLPEKVLISFLRQLRDGYVNREQISFPSSVALIGMRRIQDYKALIRSESQSLGSASPFNITTKSLTLRNFTYEEIRQLYKQHTDATGQVFEEGVYSEVEKYTDGQPWLVKSFQDFWREDASAWKDECKCSEAGPHILFMAFLQRVVNGGGRITREMALGSYKLDIGLEFMGHTYAVEIKLKKNFRREQAIKQVDTYLKFIDAPEGWLLVFDSMPTEDTNDWDRRLTWEDVDFDGRTIHIVGF